jgi:beta-galactosidase
MVSRRGFLASTSTAAGALALPAFALTGDPASTGEVDLGGDWSFRPDPADVGETERWYAVDAPPDGWRTVRVPHTWQVEEALADHRGTAWYRREIDVPATWREAAVRIEFEAVFHSARVFVNGQPAGEHLRKGYTAFTLDITRWLRWNAVNAIAVRVDNRFDDRMLPRGKSSDWAHDGGIYRPVRLLVTPAVFVERLDIRARPDLAGGTARAEVTATVRNAGARPARVAPALSIVEEDSGRVAAQVPGGRPVTVPPGGTVAVPVAADLPHARLWHFDHPHLYRARVEVDAGGRRHALESTFGVRSFEIRDTSFYLNGERVRLMGVERMAGSNPEFGMAEPAEWIDHDHADMKRLNCVFTRVHWQQDRRVLDYCDRHGILIQTEVPTWGPDTFGNMKDRCDAVIMENGLEQLREMIARDRNHPCIVSWGLCNEIGGQHAAAYDFASNMLAEAKRLDPSRPCTYASHSLFTTPGKDVAALMDFVEFNQYYGSWQKGDERDLAITVDRIHAEIPGKPIVISEYGYCACTADRPEGDQHRREVLAAQTAVLRERDDIAGLIFFCYNDYRTHVGDRGTGSAQQRVHGVVDVYGNRKPSYELLRRESSPIEAIRVTGSPAALSVTVRARRSVPAYTLRGYALRVVCFGQGGIPIERRGVPLPDLAPGGETTCSLAVADARPEWIEFDVLRPTGFSAATLRWEL